MSSVATKAAINLRNELAKVYHPRYFEKPVQKWYDNRVSTGQFGSDADWTKGTGWTISGNTASSDGTQSADADLTQTLACTIGKTYNISFDVASYSAGNVALVFDGVEVIADKAANGTYTASVVCTNATPDIDIRADLDYVGDVDNVSVREAYELPLGISVASIFEDGALLREGSAEDYTIASDGAVNTITFAVAPNIDTGEVRVEYYEEIS